MKSSSSSRARGWRGRRELAPRRSATQSGACFVGVWRDTHVVHSGPHQHHQHHPPPGAGRRVVAEGLSSQLVRPFWGLTGETRSRPGVTVAGGPRGLQGQRAGSADGRHSFGSCCPEDVAVRCRPPSGESTPRGPQSPVQSERRTLLHQSRAASGSPKVGSRMAWVVGWRRRRWWWRESGAVLGQVSTLASGVRMDPRELLDKVADMPVVVPQPQFVDKVFAIPVVLQKQIPMM